MDLWSCSKIILGSTRKYFKRSGEIGALFSSSKRALTHLGGPHYCMGIIPYETNKCIARQLNSTSADSDQTATLLA